MDEEKLQKAKEDFYRTIVRWNSERYQWEVRLLNVISVTLSISLPLSVMMHEISEVERWFLVAYVIVATIAFICGILTTHLPVFTAQQEAVKRGEQIEKAVKGHEVTKLTEIGIPRWRVALNKLFPTTSFIALILLATTVSVCVINKMPRKVDLASGAKELVAEIAAQTNTLATTSRDIKRLRKEAAQVCVHADSFTAAVDNLKETLQRFSSSK